MCSTERTSLVFRSRKISLARHAGGQLTQGGAAEEEGKWESLLRTRNPNNTAGGRMDGWME